VARVRPFKAFTYARTSPDISDLTAPPYDVISDRQRAGLLGRNAYNIVALELPEGSLDPSVPGNRYATGRHRWHDWRESGIVVRDRVPAIYVLEQRYEFEGREIRRRAFVAEVGLHSFEERVILPHERTLPKVLGDRFNLTKACAANFSPVLGLYSDPDSLTDRFFDLASESSLLMTSSDSDGVVSDVRTLTNSDTIAALAETLAEKQIFIADGHHRYATALAYRDERRAADAAVGITPKDPAYDYVMMALVNMDDPDLMVLPTHRVADAPRAFDPASFRDALSDTFDLNELAEEASAEEALASSERPAFLVSIRDTNAPLLATLKEHIDLDTVIPLEHSNAWKELDVTVLQEVILSPLLGIHPDRPETLERLAFIQSTTEALAAAASHDVAFILRPTGMDQLREVALAGEALPQKSTYFYPKLPSGLLLRGID